MWLGVGLLGGWGGGGSSLGLVLRWGRAELWGQWNGEDRDGTAVLKNYIYCYHNSTKTPPNADIQLLVFNLATWIVHWTELVVINLPWVLCMQLMHNHRSPIFLDDFADHSRIVLEGHSLASWRWDISRIIPFPRVVSISFVTVRFRWLLKVYVTITDDNVALNVIVFLICI